MGGMSKSTNFAIDFTVDQTLNGDTFSDDMIGRQGYWQREDCIWYIRMQLFLWGIY